MDSVAFRRSCLLALALLIVTTICPGKGAATTSVLLRSGVADPGGRRLSFFSAPVASLSPTTVAFVGTTSALLTTDGIGFNLIAKTGDPLPAPLTGTFNAFLDPAINDAGAIAFRATLNSPEADEGLFLYDISSFIPIVLTGGSMGGAMRVASPPDINSAFTVAFLDGAGAIFTWSPPAGPSVQLVGSGDAAPGGGTFQRFGDRPVINDSGTVAFQADLAGTLEGIFTAHSISGTALVAKEGAASPIAGGTYRSFGRTQAVSINGSGRVAFNSDITLTGPDTSGVFLYNPSGPSTTIVAQEGDLVGSETLTAFDDEYVGVDSSGDVAFEGRIGSQRKLVLSSGGSLTALTGNIASGPREFSPRLTSAGRIIWRRTSEIQRFDGAVTTLVEPSDATPIGVAVTPREPSINNLDLAAFRATQGVLYLLKHGALEVVAAPGAPSPLSGNLLQLGAHALRGNSLAFRASETTGGRLIALKLAAGSPFKVVHSTETTPLGGTFDLFDDIVDVRLREVAFVSSVSGGSASSALFRKNVATGALVALAKVGDPVPGGGLLDRFDAIRVSGNQVAFRAQLDDNRMGIFLANRTAIRTVAIDGDPAPDTGGGTLVLTSFDTLSLAAGPGRVLFAATVNGGTTPSALFQWQGGTVKKLAAEGDAAPVTGGGTFGTLGDLLPIALGAGSAFISSIDGGTVFEGIFLRRGASTRSVALAGDPISPSGTISAMNLGEPISLVNGNVVYSAGLSDAGARSGLLRSRP